MRTPDALCWLQERGYKQLGNGPALGHFVILTMLLTLGSIWLYQPCADMWTCRIQNANFGLTYALVASQLIMAHMCKEPFEPSLWVARALQRPGPADDAAAGQLLAMTPARVHVWPSRRARGGATRSKARLGATALQVADCAAGIWCPQQPHPLA